MGKPKEIKTVGFSADMAAKAIFDQGMEIALEQEKLVYWNVMARSALQSATEEERQEALGRMFMAQCFEVGIPEPAINGLRPLRDDSGDNAIFRQHLKDIFGFEVLTSTDITPPIEKLILRSIGALIRALATSKTEHSQ